MKKVSHHFENIMIMYSCTEDELIDRDCYTRWETTVLNSHTASLAILPNMASVCVHLKALHSLLLFITGPCKHEQRNSKENPFFCI